MNETLWKNQDPPPNYKCKCDSGPSTSPENEKKEMTPIEDLKAAQELIEFLDRETLDRHDKLRILALTIRTIAGRGIRIEFQEGF
ncbi:MAG: hypothetical protein V1793_25090 [Pseudomonadota bacterium]